MQKNKDINAKIFVFIFFYDTIQRITFTKQN